MMEMIIKERAPGLRRRLRAPNHVQRYRSFADVNAELEQFAVDARSAPAWIGEAHLADQRPQVTRGLWPPRSALAALPSPVELEAAAMPG